MRERGIGRSIMMRVLACGLAALCLQGGAVSGQAWPAVETETLSSSQKAAIDALAGAQLKALESARDPMDVFTAQNELVEQMRSGRITVEYRQEIAKSVIASSLVDLVGGPDTAKAISALVIAGELAVRPGDRMIQAGLHDHREAVRVAAAGAAKRTLRILAAAKDQEYFRRPGFALQRELANVLKVETSPLAARAILNALASTEDDAEFYVKGGEQLAEGLSALAAQLRAMPLDQSLSPAWAETLFWGLGATRQLMIEPNPQLQVSDDAKRSVARIGGLVLAMVKTQAANAPTDTARLENLVTQAEQVLLLVEGSLVGTPSEQTLTSAFKDGIGGGDWQRFEDAVDAWVGSRGKLTHAPFGFAAADF